MASVSNWPRLDFRPRLRGRNGAVAQLGERLICIQEVAGSIPTSSTSSRLLSRVKGKGRYMPLVKGL